MTIEEILSTLETTRNPIDLNSVQELVLRQVWEGKTYTQIAVKTGYNTDYIKSVGAELWQLFSKVLGEPVTKRNFRHVINRQLRQLQPRTPQPQIPVFNPQAWVESLPPCFFGRTEELATLKKWILRDKCNLVSVLGMEGVGKTALTVQCAEQMKGEFEQVIWRSLPKTPHVDELLADWLQVLSNGQETNLPEDTEGKISRLITYLRDRRCLLVIDHYESMLESSKQPEYNSSSMLSRRYVSSNERYAQLLQRIGEEHHQSCLLLTTSETYLKVSPMRKENSPIRSLKLKGLGFAAARELLRVAGLSGSDSVCNQLIERYVGNPLALKIVAVVIRELFNRDIALFLAQDIFIFDKLGNLLDQLLTHLPDWDVAG